MRYTTKAVKMSITLRGEKFTFSLAVGREMLVVHALATESEPNVENPMERGVGTLRANHRIVSEVLEKA